MSEKMYLIFLILCGILCQGLIATSSVEEMRESSNSLVRKKRVITLDPAGDVPRPIENFPYVVNIKKKNRNHCVGSILSRYSVVTAAHCVHEAPSTYKVFSGSELANGGNIHNVTEIKFCFNGEPDRIDGIALVQVMPRFVFSITTLPIHLHTEPLLPGTLATVSGWGVFLGRPGTQHGLNLRAIAVAIMRHQDCVNVYRNLFDITEKDICTTGVRTISCTGNSDGGAPLVINGLLAGVFIWRRNLTGSPDVFVVLQHSQFKQWISSNIVL